MRDTRGRSRGEHMTCVGGWTQIAGTWPALSSRGGEVKGVEEEREGGILVAGGSVTEKIIW